MQQAAELPVAAGTIAASLDGRILSALKDERVEAAKFYSGLGLEAPGPVKVCPFHQTVQTLKARAMYDGSRGLREVKAHSRLAPEPSALPRLGEFLLWPCRESGKRLNQCCRWLVWGAWQLPAVMCCHAWTWCAAQPCADFLKAEGPSRRPCQLFRLARWGQDAHGLTGRLGASAQHTCPA